MSGHVKGVQKRLKDLQFGLVYTHCVAHRLELAVLDSIKFDDTYLASFDLNINNIFKFYYYSAVRRKELKAIGDLLQDEFKSLGLLKNIRWVASRSRALNLLETNYKALVYDLESKSYGTDETAKKALGYVEFIKKPQFLFYLHFFQDLVVHLKKLSLIFQNDKLLICEVPRQVSEQSVQLDALSITNGESLNRLIAGLSMIDQNENIEFKETILDRPDGRRALKIDHTPASYEEHFKSTSFATIITGIKKYLKRRFEDFEKRPLAKITKIFDYKHWPRSFETTAEKKWGISEIKSLTEFYKEHGFISAEEATLAVYHWPVFRHRVNKCRNDKLYVYTDLLKEDDPDVSGMFPLLQIMMTISGSTAACERGFSSMNRQKTSLRTTMTHATLDDIMRLCVDGGAVSAFDPVPHYKSWLASAEGRRHITGHKKPVKKKE